MRLWGRQLADVDGRRSRYQNTAAEGLVDFDELLCKLSVLEAEHSPIARELETLSDRAERCASLKVEMEALLEAYAYKASRGLELYRPDDKHAAYRALDVTCQAY